MGDQRYEPHFDRIAKSGDMVSEIAHMSDDEVVQALGAASRKGDPYLANVLTTAALNSTRRTRAILENLGEGVCAIDPLGVVVAANPAAHALLGRASGEIVGKHLHALVHAHLGEGHEAYGACDLDAALGRAEEVARITTTASRLDGTTRDVSCTISPILLEDITQGRIVLFQDITERKRAETLLAQQARVLEGTVERVLAELEERADVERWSTALFEASPDALVLTRGDATIAMVNAASERLFGYTRDELVGKDASILLPPPDADPSAAATRKGGRVLPVKVSRMPFPLGGEPWLLTSYRGSTAPVAPETRASETAPSAPATSGAWSSAIVDKSNEGLVVLAPDGSLLQANAAAHEFGVTDGGPVPVEVLARLAAEETADHVSLLTANGGRTIEVTTRRLRDADGRVGATLATLRDVSRVVALENELRAAKEELDSRVKSATLGWERAYRELEAFSYTVSHDLQAPLRALDQLLTAVVEDHPDLDRTVLDDLGRIQQEATRMRKLVRALLDLSRLGLRELERSSVDLSEIARVVTDKLRAQHPGREVHVSIEPGLHAHADPSLVRSLLENLLSNAWKYSSTKPIAHVEVGMVPGSSPTTFYVKDDGVGFDMALAPRLFQPFSRLHASPAFEGVGVGLAGGRRIVEKHGGRIWAQSEPGRGATFYFTLAG